MSISSICVSLLLCPHLLTHISLILSFLLFCLLSPLACSVFCSCPVLSDFAQTRLALGKGSPESALSTPGSPHHEYIMIPPFPFGCHDSTFWASGWWRWRQYGLTSGPQSDGRLYSFSIVILTVFACCGSIRERLYFCSSVPTFLLPRGLLCLQSAFHCLFFGICIKHGASGRGCCPVNGQRVHAPNTSLSNLSACQQHMFCKKLPVGARGKDRSCQTIEEMLPPLALIVVGFLMLICSAQSRLSPPPLNFRNLNCETLGGLPALSFFFFFCYFFLFRSDEMVEIYCSQSPSGLL